jgi:hypothetical protein
MMVAIFLQKNNETPIGYHHAPPWSGANLPGKLQEAVFGIRSAIPQSERKGVSDTTQGGGNIPRSVRVEKAHP